MNDPTRPGSFGGNFEDDLEADLEGDIEDESGDDTAGDDTAGDDTAGDDTAGESQTSRVWTDAEVEALLAAREAEQQDRHVRLAAEYQNFRRRVEREKEQWSDEALERFAADLLPVLDSFQRALAAREQDPVAAASGLDLVERQFVTALEKHGMTPVDPLGQAFDPKLHEALFRTPTTEKPPGTVLSVLERGWVMRSRLLRAARVQVASAPEKE